jgi:hypothetical protein
VLTFGVSVLGSGRTTTHVPHFGHVPDEHTMRWRIQSYMGIRSAFPVFESALTGNQHLSAIDGQEKLL